MKLSSGRQKFLQNYKLRRRFSQGAIQPIREILEEMEEREKMRSVNFKILGVNFINILRF